MSKQGWAARGGFLAWCCGICLSFGGMMPEGGRLTEFAIGSALIVGSVFATAAFLERKPVRA